MLDEIVLIDDDKIFTSLNKKFFEDLLPNATIKTFDNGEKGLVYLLNSIDSHLKTLVFLDINMPIMDGFQFLNVYENAIAYQDHSFVICLLTSSLEEADQQKAAKFPSVLEYTQKPLSKDKIQTLIEAAAKTLNERESY